MAKVWLVLGLSSALRATQEGAEEISSAVRYTEEDVDCSSLKFVSSNRMMSPKSERSWLSTGRPASASTTVKNATKIDGNATGSIIHTLRSTIALRSCKPILTPRPRMTRCVQLRDGKTGVRMIGAWPWAPSSAVPIPSSAVPFARKWPRTHVSVARRRSASWQRAVSGKTHGSSPRKRPQICWSCVC